MPTPSEEAAYHELCAYTLTHAGRTFIHQHVVDAYLAQIADDSTKPLGLCFALIGLYLHLEKGCTGRQVQEAHMQMGRTRRPWPKLPLPGDRGGVHPADVMRQPEDEAREAAIERWAASVWEAWRACHEQIRALAQEALATGSPRPASRGRR